MQKTNKDSPSPILMNRAVAFMWVWRKSGYMSTEGKTSQYTYTIREVTNSEWFGLYRVDITMTINFSSRNHFQSAFETVLKENSAVPIDVIIDPQNPISIDMGIIKIVDDVNCEKGDIQFQSRFLHGYDVYDLTLTKDGWFQLSGLSNLKKIEDMESFMQEKIDDVANEYAAMIQRIIKVNDVEASVRRIEYIRQSIDRHLPLIERLQAMQRRLEHDCHAFKRWWYQLRGKVSELSHIVVDSTYDLALELEQNSRRINKNIDQVLKNNVSPFMKWGDSYVGTSGADRLVDYLASGGKYRVKIIKHSQNINAQLEGDRTVLDKVSSLVDSSDQRSTNRALNRIQSWGSLLAVVAIFTGFIGNFSLDGMGYLTDEILKSTYFLSFSILSFAGIILYAMSLLRRKAIEERRKIAFRIVLSLSIIILIYDRFYFNTTSSSWLQVNDMFEGIPLLYGITFFFVICSSFLLLRQKDLQTWLTLKKVNKEQISIEEDNFSLFRVEGEILDIYENIAQKESNKASSEGEENENNKASSEGEAGNFKKNWQYLAKTMDAVDAGKYKNKSTSQSFKEQVDGIRDEVLLARAVSQCILRLPSEVKDIKIKGVAEHVVFRANIDFDQMPNTEKIALIHQDRLPPVYLVPYTLADYLSCYIEFPDEVCEHYCEGMTCSNRATTEYGDVGSAIGKNIYALILESICLYLDAETLELIEKSYVLKRNLRDNIIYPEKLKARLLRHVSKDMVNIFLLYFEDSDDEEIPVELEDVERWVSKGESHALNVLPSKKIEELVFDIKRFVVSKNTDVLDCLNPEKTWAEAGVYPTHELYNINYSSLNEKMHAFVKGKFIHQMHAYQLIQPLHQDLILRGDSNTKIMVYEEIEKWLKDDVPTEIIADDLLLMARNLVQEANTDEKWANEYRDDAKFMYEKFWDLVYEGNPITENLDEIVIEYADFLSLSDSPEDIEKSNKFYNKAKGFYDQTTESNKVKRLFNLSVEFKIVKNNYKQVKLGNKVFEDGEIISMDDIAEKFLMLLRDSFSIGKLKEEILCELELSLNQKGTTATSLKQQYDSILEKGLFETRNAMGVTPNSRYILKGECIDVVISLCALQEYDDAKRILDKLYSKFEVESISNKYLLDKIKDFVSSKINEGGDRVGGI